MKTRRSLRLQNSFSNNSMQAVLFPSKRGKNISNIVPETPGNYYSSVKSTLASPTASVLETPDDNQIKITKHSEGDTNPRQISLIREESTCPKSQSTNQEEFFRISNGNSDLTLNKRMAITDFLESDYSLERCDAGKKENILPLYEGEPISPIRKGRKSLAETIFPFDLNNEKVMSKKQSSLSLRMENKCKPGQRKSLKSSFNSPSSTNCSMSIEHNGQNSMSLDNLNDTIINSSRKKLRQSINATKLSFENSDLDLTNINKEIIDDHSLSSSCLQSIPKLNFSTTDDESDEVFLTSSTNKQENSNVSIEKFSPSREKLLKSKRKLSLFKENSSPMTNYQRIIEELSPLNRSIFHLQESFTPTQPASVLILQGIVAFVDVRSEAENRSSVFKDVLLELGAEIAEKFTIDVTHVIFREGSRLTYQRSIQRGVHLVSPLWVDACKVKEVRVSESLFPISADYTTKMMSGVRKIFPRKMKSMQPRDLADEVMIAEIRQKRKQRLLTVSSNLPEPQTQMVKPSTCSKDINSPIFGIAHLLTPVQEKAKKSTESESSEKSSTEKELSTPLAARMYNRFLSPISNSPQLSVNLPSTSLKKPHEEDQNQQVRIPQASTPRRRSIRLYERLTVKLPVGEEKDSQMKENDTTLSDSTFSCPKSSGDQVFDGSSLILNSDKSMLTRHNLTNYSKKLSLAIDNFESTPKKRKIKSKDEDKLQKSILKKDGSSHHCSGSHSVSYKKSHVEYSIRTEPSTSSFQFGTSSGNVHSSSLSCFSPELSQDVRKRRLHTVEIIEPSQDLIVPSTPPISVYNSKVGPYDTLQKQFPLSQREEMRHLNKNFKAGISMVPLPRTRNENKVSSLTCDKIFDSKSPLSKQENVPVQKTPKGRFSLVPNGRKSLEEFQSPLNQRRRVANYTKTRFNGLPSICVTSVRSSNIGTLYAIIKSLGGFRIMSDVGDTTTHVICGAEKRTLNVLLGISLGCWILDVSWLYESVELLKWAPEEPFELFMFCPGAQISRRSSHSDSSKPNLFHNLGRIYVSQSNEPPQYVVQSLLQNCGANLCSTIRSADLIVGGEKLDTSLKQVHTSWVFDSIQFWNVKKIENYLI